MTCKNCGCTECQYANFGPHLGAAQPAPSGVRSEISLKLIEEERIKKIVEQSLKDKDFVTKKEFDESIGVLARSHNKLGTHISLFRQMKR